MGVQGVPPLHATAGPKGTTSTPLFLEPLPLPQTFLEPLPNIFFKTHFWDLYPTFFLKPWDVNVILMVKNQSKVNNSMTFSSLNVKFCCWPQAWQKCSLKYLKISSKLPQNRYPLVYLYPSDSVSKVPPPLVPLPLDDESKVPPQCRFSTPPYRL